MSMFRTRVRPWPQCLLLTSRRDLREVGRLKPWRAWLCLEALETRCVPSTYRPIDEVGNNAANPTWGAAPADQPGGAPIQLLRNSPVAYADGISAPSLPDNPSPRVISNQLNDQANPADPSQDIQIGNRESLADFAYVFGQFMDHDLDLTLDGGARFDIAVPPGDPIGPDPLPFTRSQFDPTTGTSDPRQQVNSITSFLDLSQVYGSDGPTATALRTHHGGLLKTSPGNMLPYNNISYFSRTELRNINAAEGGMQNEGPLPSTSLFVTGDVRGNENIELTALQTLFLRNHNRLAGQLALLHSSWSDEQLYQTARDLNIAQYQTIIYTQYLPDVLGRDAVPAYAGYDPSVNPSISTEFSTVGFRFGHSLLSDTVNRHTNLGLDINAVGGAPVNLAVDFFDPNLISSTGGVDPLTGQSSSDIGPILKGDADNTAQAMDLAVINEVRNLLFGNGQGGMDLIARDLQRARDHGIGSYNQVRVAYGLPAVTSFADISSDVQVQQMLQQAYGSVDNVDPLEGGMAEDHVAGAAVGPLFQRIMADQFTRLRDGDSFFYLNESFTPEEQNLIRGGDTLGKIITANTNVVNLQTDVFKFHASISGTVSILFGSGVPGVTVQLKDTSGNVLASTVTDSRGNYRFDENSGPAADPSNDAGVSGTGYYDVSLVLTPNLIQVTPDPPSILMTRGDTNVPGISFGVITVPSTAGSNTALVTALTGDSGAPVATPLGTGSVAGTDLSPPAPATGSDAVAMATSPTPTAVVVYADSAGPATTDSATSADSLGSPLGEPVLG